MTRKILGSLGLTVLLLVMFAAPASATLINFGVDIHADGSFTLLPGGYTASPDGFTLGNGVSAPNTYTLILDTTTAFGGGIISGATIFIDGEEIAGFFVDDVNVTVQGGAGGTMQGSFSIPPTNIGGGACGPGIDFTNAVACIPNLAVLGGSLATVVGDNANYFFALTASQTSDLGTDTTYTISFFDVTGNPFHFARIDGINIQADVSTPQVPEPSTLLLLGTGLLGLSLWGGRRLRRHVNG